MDDRLDVDPVRAYLTALQVGLCDGLRELDPALHERRDEWTRPQGGGGVTRVMDGGGLFEKAGIGFSDVHGAKLPASASALRPELAGCGFRAMGVSVVIHPLNPHVPTTHMNVRFFQALPPGGGGGTWWFGGGFDLTPYYPHREDVLGWHRAAQAAVQPFGPDLYPRFKAWCDDYFHIRHRDETRGVGGLFFDDYNAEGFDTAFGLMRSVGSAFFPAYRAICERRRGKVWTDRERQFQLYRRGRYVEFNLVHDRGTLFGLQSGGRTESILMSLPPLVRWDYDWHPEPGSPEEALYKDYLHPRDWLGEETEKEPDNVER